MGGIEMMEKYFMGRLDEALDDGSQYPIFLVAIGEKNGALTMNCNEDQIELLKKMCDDLGLSYRIGEGRRSKPSRNVGENTKMDQKGFFIADNSKRFQMLEEGRFYGFNDRSVGKFLGFPEKAIEFFVSNEQPGMVSRQKISELKEEKVFEEELRFLNLITYIPPPDEDSIREGVNKGLERKKALEDFDKKNKTEIGNKLIEKRISRNLYR